MTELKTLKDIHYCLSDDHFISEKTLRREAIKWIKTYIEKGLLTKDEAIKFTMLGASQSLIEFFNITEEDLK